MKIVLLILSFYLTIDSYEQKASFKEIKLAPNPKYYNTKKATIIFPIVVTKNAQIDELINSRIEDDMFQLEGEKQSIRNVLDEHINDYGLINLSYEVTYNNFGLLSFSIYAEGCGAHCSSWQTHFNFDLVSGEKNNN